MLVFPAKAANAKLPRRFAHRHAYDLSLHTIGLIVGDILQRGVGNTFHEAESHKVCGHASSANGLSTRHALLGLFVRVIVDDGVRN